MSAVTKRDTASGSPLHASKPIPVSPKKTKPRLQFTPIRGLRKSPRRADLTSAGLARRPNLRMVFSFQG
jgi:hypothetical protein